MTDTNSEDEKSGACRRGAARVEVQQDPLENDTTTTRSAECVVVLPFTVIRKYWFQNANRLPRCTVAHSPRGCAGKLGVGERWRWRAARSGARCLLVPFPAICPLLEKVKARIAPRQRRRLLRQPVDSSRSLCPSGVTYSKSVLKCASGVRKGQSPLRL